MREASKLSAASAVDTNDAGRGFGGRLSQQGAR